MPVDPEVLRLDDLVRSERYFTATLLPSILLHDEFNGAREFLRLVDEKARTEWVIEDSSGDGLPRQQPRSQPIYDWTAPIQLITEFHIARDLNAAGVRWIPERLRGADEADPESRDAPDLALLVGDELIVCEGKFFHREPKGKLQTQLRSQRRQIAYLFRYRPIRAFCHIALLPDPPFSASAIVADAILTWEEVTELSSKVLGEPHYVTTRLRKATASYRQQHSPGRGLGVFWDGEDESLDQVIEWCRVFGKDVEIGHDNGAGDLRRRGYEYAVQKSWRWRDASGRRRHTNWIPGPDFLELIADLQEQRLAT